MVAARTIAHILAGVVYLTVVFNALSAKHVTTRGRQNFVLRDKESFSMTAVTHTRVSD